MPDEGRKTGTISARDSALKESAALFEEVGLFGGLMVFVGVATEVGLLIWPVPNERFAAVLANIFVAAGVGIEVLFTRMASRRQGVLIERSNNKLGKVMADAARANWELL